MADVSSILKQLKAKRDRVAKHLSAMDAALRAFAGPVTCLLDQQREFLNATAGAFTKKMTPEEIDGYAERNERLRELCGELNNLG